MNANAIEFKAALVFALNHDADDSTDRLCAELAELNWAAIQPAIILRIEVECALIKKRYRTYQERLAVHRQEVDTADLVHSERAAA